MARVVFAIVVLLVATERDADACSLAVPVHVLPALGGAPIDTHVWIRHPPWKKSDADYVLRGAAEIPAQTREWCPNVLVELVPDARLAPTTRFEVWVVPHGNHGPALLSSFATGTDVAKLPPASTLTGVTHKSEGTGMTCPITQALVFKGPTEPDALYALWPTATPASSAPPFAVMGADLHLDDFNVCQANVPRDWTSWSASSPHVTVRAMNMAGAYGPPIVLDVR
jgi:hypothetical protein